MDWFFINVLIFPSSKTTLDNYKNEKNIDFIIINSKIVKKCRFRFSKFFEISKLLPLASKIGKICHPSFLLLLKISSLVLKMKKVLPPVSKISNHWF